MEQTTLTNTQLNVDERVVQHQSVPKRISKISFGVLGENEIRKASTIEVFNREMYTIPERKPFPHGALDGRLGTSSKRGTCDTCGLPLKDCVGHFGYVKLELPCFHIGYFKSIQEILQRICKTCSRILIPEETRQKYLHAFRRKPPIETLRKKALAKRILDECKKVSRCPHCDALNGPVKKVSAVRLVHEVWNSKAKDKGDEYDKFKRQFEEAQLQNPDLKPYISKAQDDITPLRCLEIFRKISNDDVELLDMDPKFARPENLIWTYVLVPPVCIRPSVPSDMGSNEDDLTVTLTKIIHTNEIIKEDIQKGIPMDQLMNTWDFLQQLLALYINSEQPGLTQAKEKSSKPIRSFVQRLKGKHGRFRGNLSGKRVDFSARTVISPDPNVAINQVVVPILVAKVLTFPERVTPHNIERMRQLVRNGPDIHPGANFVESNGMKRYLKFANREKAAQQLKVGDIIERHLDDGDYVLFNRQPSLHRLSIQCHRAKVLPYRTFRFNICVCGPYNADFDGDEMNLHLPQTQEARAEAAHLMSVTNNMLTPKNGEPVVGASQDLITGSFLMTRKNMFFTRGEFCMLCSYMGIEDAKIDLPPPAILKPVELWTGKQLFSLLIKPNKSVEVYLNLETPAKNYNKKLNMKHLDPNDGYVCIKNGEYISGNLDKSVVGSGSKTTLFYVIQKNYGPAYAAECMARVSKVTTRFLKNYGFSIGIDDVQPSERLTRQKEELVTKGYEEADRVIKQFEDGKLEAQPGMTEEETLEGILNKLLSDLRNDGGKICLEELHWSNAPLIMATCGSKGSNINISQMVALVGQQTVGGSRIQNGFINRTLPHFPYNSRKPAAKGFVRNSFYTGLNPTEYFFHTQGGREGLVDTAVKTAATGYMQRRLMKALEDLSVAYDQTVRSASGGIIQFNYGDDGLDPIHMEGDDGPLNFNLLLLHIVNTNPCPQEVGLKADEIERISEKFFVDNAKFFSEKFIKEAKEFIAAQITELKDIRVKMIDLSDEEFNSIVDKIFRITKTQLTLFLEECKKRYVRFLAEPGEAVGAIAAQSIGEPGTQMTLKTFHFAGVASMNITLGVPRIVEIINATRNISTPIITAQLVNNESEVAARMVKGRIEKTTLGQIAEYIREVYDLGVCYIDIKLDAKTINALQLEITLESVKRAIEATPKLKVKDKHIKLYEETFSLRVYPTTPAREEMYFNIQFLKRRLPLVIVSGIPTVNRAIISKKEKKSPNEPVKYELLVEGTNLLGVMGTAGVDGRLTKSNNVLEVESTLGIEAARWTIMNEIQYTMSSHGMSIDSRHVMLLGDVMTFKGEVLGITRFGISKMKDSVLMLASFERTTDHLFDAAVHCREDNVEGVSECIIMGIPINVGTGSFKLVRDVIRKPKPKKVPLFFNYENKHIM